MARIDTVPNFCTDIANAIRKKTGTTDKILAKDFDIKIDEISSGIDINGIIEEYKVSSDGNVNAGDFVRFLTDYSETDEIKDTALKTTANAGKVISAVKLNEERVFITYNIKSSNSTIDLYGLICTISEANITVGTDTLLNSNGYSEQVISAVKLNEGKVFIAYTATLSRQLYGIVCEISGTKITKGTDKQLSSIDHSGDTISAVKLDEGKVFIAHSYGSSYYLYGMVCTISGTMITKGTDTQLSSIQNSGKVISVAKLDEGKVFIAHYENGLFGMVCTISGTSISKGTNTQIILGATVGNTISVVKSSENKVFIAFSSGAYCTLYVLVCTILGTTITAGAYTMVNGTENAGKAISAVALNENQVNIIHGNSNNYLYSMICNISGTTITKENDIQLSSTANSESAISAVALSENNIFIAHSFGTNNYLYGMVIGYLANLVKTITSSTEKIDGIAITDGQAGEMVQVKKPM